MRNTIATIATIAATRDTAAETIATIAHQLADHDGPENVYGPDTGVGPKVEVAGMKVSTGVVLTDTAVEQIDLALETE
jgi:hypothetical protein